RRLEAEPLGLHFPSWLLRTDGCSGHRVSSRALAQRLDPLERAPPRGHGIRISNLVRGPGSVFPSRTEDVVRSHADHRRKNILSGWIHRHCGPAWVDGGDPRPFDALDGHEGASGLPLVLPALAHRQFPSPTG